MPVYNEAGTVDRAIAQVLEADLGVSIELIVVDDGSTDGSSDILQNGAFGDGVTVLQHDRNQGKGAAVRSGLEKARGEFAAIFDADLEYEPDDLRALLPP